MARSPDAAVHALRDDASASDAGRGVLADAYLFLRVSVFGFTAMLPLLGALTSSRSIGLATLSGLLVVAASFHVFAYLLNDVVDLELDKREPQRARDPLVRGTIRPVWALTAALAQIPIALLAALSLGGGFAALAALGLSFVSLAAYDLWGKRCPIPPALELVQGIGWSALALFGAWSVGAPGPRAYWLCGAVIAYVMLVNAVHGGLRDLRNDLACGARTTAVYFGASVASATHAVVVPPLLIAYAAALHIATIGAAVAVLGPPSSDLSWWAAASILALAVVACVQLALTAYLRRHDRAPAESAGTRHLFVSMTLLAIPFIAHAEPASIAVVGLVLALPALATWMHRKAAPR